MDKQFWISVIRNEYAIPAGYTLLPLTEELFSFIHATDPLLRDAIGLEVFFHWLDRGLYSPEDIRRFIPRLLANLQAGLGEKESDSVFQDCKDLLGLDRLMNKQQAHMEQMVALTFLTYVPALFVGEALRDVCYGARSPEQITYESLLAPRTNPTCAKWKQYSGLFILLKQQLRIPTEQFDRLLLSVSQAFASLVLGNVRTFV